MFSMVHHDISAAFRTTEVSEVHYFNERQKLEQVAQNSNISMSQASRIGSGYPSTIVLQQAFPEHHLSRVPAIREEHAWGSALAAAMPMRSVDPQRLQTAVLNMLSDSAPFPRTITPRDAIAVSLASNLFMRYLGHGVDRGLPPAVQRARALIRELPEPFDTTAMAVAPSDEEVAILDGEGVLGACPGIRFAESIFGGACLAWFAEAPDVQLAVWRAAFVEFIDSMPAPWGSFADGFCNRREVRQVCAKERLALPENYAPCNRGLHLCTRDRVFVVLCIFEDRILVQPDRMTEQGEFERGRRRAELLERLHPDGDVPVQPARVIAAPKGLFEALPTINVKRELLAHGWFAAFRLARKTENAVEFDRGLSVVKAYFENADDELQSVVDVLPEGNRELEFAMPEGGVRKELTLASEYLKTY